MTVAGSHGAVPGWETSRGATQNEGFSVFPLNQYCTASGAQRLLAGVMWISRKSQVLSICDVKLFPGTSGLAQGSWLVWVMAFCLPPTPLEVAGGAGRLHLQPSALACSEQALFSTCRGGRELVQARGKQEISLQPLL